MAERKYQLLAAASTQADGSNKRDNNDNGEQDLSYNHVSDYAPFFEIDAHWQSVSSGDDNNNKILAESIRENHERLGRRVFNTHLRWDMLPKRKEGDNAICTQNDDVIKNDGNKAVESTNDDNTNNNDGNQTTTHTNDHRPQCGKFIYITRNQIDVVASFYHHLSNQKEGTYTESFTTFFRDWMAGKIPFGSSLHHLIGFAEGFASNVYDASSSSSSSSCGGGDIGYCNKDNDINGTGSNDYEQPLLLLSYEHLKSNLRSEVLRIITFLNLTHIPQHVLDEEILPSFEFNDMKRNIDKFQPKSVGWLNGFQFLRRGVTGDGKKLLLGDSDSVGEEESVLMKEYVDWVESEEYRSKIESLLDDERNDEYRDVFLSVVKK